MKAIEIFKPGRHMSVNGEAIDFTEEMLRKSVEAYDPAVHEAPMVIGHPQVDAPAYGWVREVSYSDGVMTAVPSEVDPAFAEMVSSGKFKKRSASFYRPSAPNNPKPGVYYLRHVGFLGAQPPAVKGLKNVEFGEAGDGIVEFGDYDDLVNAGLWRRLREWIIGKFGQEDADRVVPNYDVSALEMAANQPEPVEEAPAGFAEDAKTEEEEDMKKEELEALEAGLRKKEADFAEREAALRKKEADARHAGHVAFAEDLVKAGKLLPAQKDRAVAILDFTSGMEGGAVEFSEGEVKKTLPVAEVFKELLSAQPRVVEFGERAGEEKASKAATLDYSGKVDEERLDLHNRALAYMEKNRGTDYKTALEFIIKEAK